MSIFGWILLGLVAGFLASKIVDKSGGGMLFDVFLGVIGALAGGFLVQPFWRYWSYRVQHLQSDCCGGRLCRGSFSLSYADGAACNLTRHAEKLVLFARVL